MASGVGLVNSSSFKGFDFASNDVLCSFNKQSGGKLHSDLETGKDFSKDFQRSRMTTRCSPSDVYNKLDEPSYQEIFSLVEKCMKRHTDDIVRILQGISSRLEHLELYCYNVDKSVGEIAINLGRDYEETDARLKSLDNHLKEVSRSVQILRDKQELSENQKKIANLQLAQKETSCPNVSQHNGDRSIRSTSPASDYHETDDTYEAQNQHLAIVLHNQQQAVPQQQMSPARPAEVAHHVAPPSQVAHQNMSQPQHMYLTPALAPYQVQVQASQGHYFTSDAQYHAPQFLQPNINCVQIVPTQVSQAPPQIHHFIQYQQQPQQPQHILHGQIPVQQPPTQVMSRPQSAFSYSPQQPSQVFLQTPREAVSTSIHTPTPFSSMPQQVVTCAKNVPNGYGGGQVHQLPPQPQQIKDNFRAPHGEIYKSMGPHHSLSTATDAAYIMYGNKEVKMQPLPQSQFSQVNQPSYGNPSCQHPQHVSNVNSSNQTQFIGDIAHNGQAINSFYA